MLDRNQLKPLATLKWWPIYIDECQTVVSGHMKCMMKWERERESESCVGGEVKWFVCLH